MLKSILQFSACWSSLALVDALPLGLHGGTVPVVPSEDPFYTVQNGLARVEPGTILRHRLTPAPIAAFTEYLVNIEASYQVLYRTTDSSGASTATVLTILVPHNADYSKVLSYQVAEDAACPDCAPSYVFQLNSLTGPDDGTSTTQLEILLIEAALEQGWVVILPDHEGHTAAFLANRLAGQATLDGIRAALSSGYFSGIETNSTVAMWGYSGGSVVTGWAAELQPTYAPELRISGAAVGGTVPNIHSVITTVNNGPYSGLIPSGLNGLSAQFPKFKEALKAHLKPAYKNEFYKPLNQCEGANGDDFENRDIVAMFDDGFLLSDPLILKTLKENDLGNTTPKIPLYWYKSVEDEVSGIADTDKLVAEYCNDGANIEYVRDLASNHATLAVFGAFKALAWLKDVMNGVDPSPGCTTETILTSLLDLATIEFIPKFIIDALLDLIGKPVGQVFLR